MNNYDLEYKLKEFREEQKELFNETGKRYTGVSLSHRQAEFMLSLIDDLENRVKELEETADKLFDMVHQSNINDLKIKANDLYEIIDSDIEEQKKDYYE